MPTASPAWHRAMSQNPEGWTFYWLLGGAPDPWAQPPHESPEQLGRSLQTPWGGLPARPPAPPCEGKHWLPGLLKSPGMGLWLPGRPVDSNSDWVQIPALSGQDAGAGTQPPWARSRSSTMMTLTSSVSGLLGGAASYSRLTDGQKAEKGVGSGPTAPKQGAWDLKTDSPQAQLFQTLCCSLPASCHSGPKMCASDSV